MAHPTLIAVSFQCWTQNPTHSLPESRSPHNDRPNRSISPMDSVSFHANRWPPNLPRNLFSFPWLRRKASGQYDDRLASHSNDIVWQLNLKRRLPLGITSFSSRGSLPTTKDNESWRRIPVATKAIGIPASYCQRGFLKRERIILSPIDYEIIDCSGQGSYFYLLPGPAAWAMVRING